MKNKGFTLVELLVLLALAGLMLTFSLPNLALARQKANLRDTIQLVYTISVGIESGRVELMKDEFVSKVNQLNDLTQLSAQDCPWLVPKYLKAQTLRTTWGGRMLFQADEKSGRVNIGAPGRSGILRISLDSEPVFYQLDTVQDCDRGIVFRDGRMVVGPELADSKSR